MNRVYVLVFMCFYINLMINVFNANVYSDISIPDYDENELNELTYKDKFNLHHGFVIEDRKWDSGIVNFKIDKNFSCKLQNYCVQSDNEIIYPIFLLNNS